MSIFAMPKERSQSDMPSSSKKDRSRSPMDSVATPKKLHKGPMAAEGFTQYSTSDAEFDEALQIFEPVSEGDASFSSPIARPNFVPDPAAHASGDGIPSGQPSQTQPSQVSIATPPIPHLPSPPQPSPDTRSDRDILLDLSRSTANSQARMEQMFSQHLRNQ